MNKKTSIVLKRYCTSSNRMMDPGKLPASNVPSNNRYYYRHIKTFYNRLPRNIRGKYKMLLSTMTYKNNNKEI